MKIAIAAFLFTALTAAGQVPPLDERPVTVPEYSAVPHIERYASREEYEAARRDSKFRLTRVSYESGGLTVFAYVYAPTTVSRQSRPVVVFSRGSYVWKEFAGEYLTTFHRLAVAGFTVAAPMYRGSGGAAGRDEMGGADLEDLLNTAPLLRRLPGVNTELVFLYGESRGGMMTYQAIRERYPMRAAAVCGGFTDLAPLAGPGGKFARAAAAIWPDYAELKAEIDSRRSAIAWPEAFHVPVLIMHGGADTDVSPSHALALAAKLQELGKPYEIVIRAGANHVLTEWRTERDALAVEWFRRHMPD
ncbi:MAG TPA: prolyl oligopeptidase family serine peptidase [Thermoanaerobaculia bacterium]|jgi:dipeptidyl aminopeptidase/acylaminoacyl peptidase|nr:prolyl oligopeptidase family serine peptidase [Thermoanaerobaculia bacterium]